MDKLSKLPYIPELVHPVKVETALQRRMAETQTVIQFLTYQEDQTLRLFKEGSMLSMEPAGYNDTRVVIKARVTRPGEDFVVILTVNRKDLDRPGYADELAAAAFEWRRR